MISIIGLIFTLNAVITWALASLVYKAGLSKTNPKATILFRLIIVSLFTFIIAYFLGDFIAFFNFNLNKTYNYLFFCLISGISVTIGDFCYFYSLRLIDASRAYPLTQLSLVFVYPFAFLFFGEEITFSIIFGGALILSSVFLLSSKDNDKKIEKINDNNDIKKNISQEKLLEGVILAIGTALFWAIAIVAFHQARIISGDVFLTNFFRVFFAMLFVFSISFFKREYLSSFKQENRHLLKYYGFIGLAGALSLGLADSLFYKAAELNGLVLTSTITANTPMVQQIFSVLILREKFRKRFIIAVCLIILGNYLILFI
ncbi:MAG: EamA family transporter [Promethearchaeota archaeon]